MNDHCDREDYLFTTPHTYAPLGTTGRTTYDTTYTLNCQRCRDIHYSPNGFAPHCPRCQQLAELEAEIGRAVIGYSILDTDFDRIPDSTDNVVLVDYAYFMGTLELAQWQAVARWRELHAEGAEAEAATERQEGE